MSLTVIPSSGEISFSNIQTVFGGNNPISLSEYYADASGNYTSGVSGIPSIGSQISLSNFYGKSKVINYLVSGTKTGSMSEPVGTTTLPALTNQDNAIGSLDSGAFTFYFFGTNYQNNIRWDSNNVLVFGFGFSSYTSWTQTTGKGILLGHADRKSNTVKVCPITNVNGYSIKRILIDSNYSNVDYNTIKMEIRLIRGPIAQYVEVRFSQWNILNNNVGIWNITDGTTFKNIMTNYSPISSILTSFVLKSDLNGENWEFFGNSHINL
jgi:hypothetical protein